MGGCSTSPSTTSWSKSPWGKGVLRCWDVASLQSLVAKECLGGGSAWSCSSLARGWHLPATSLSGCGTAGSGLGGFSLEEEEVAHHGFLLLL